MNTDDTEYFLQRIEAGWTDSRWSEERRDIWREQLAALDAGAAGTALVELIKTRPKCPSFAELRAIAEPPARPSPSAPARPCGYCDGNGLVECRDDRRHGPDCKREGDCLCTAAVPCMACPRGRQIAHRQQEVG